MVKLPSTDSTVKRIYEAWEKKKEHDDQPWSDNGWREHLGGSLIGRECSRQIWLSWRWALPVSFPGRILRLFDTGHREEPRLVADLRATGATVFDHNPVTGGQFRVSAHGGHLGGSLDSLLLGIVEAPKSWHVGEFKTCNEKTYKQLTHDDPSKAGVRNAKPEHFGQMQTYVGLWNEKVDDIRKRLEGGVELVGLEELVCLKIGKIKRMLYLARCKNDDRIYSERVHFDRAIFEELKSKARRILETDEAPDRISEDPSFWKCKWCDFQAVCQPNAPSAKIPSKNCRTCAFSSPVLEGKGARWRCSRLDIPLSPESQFAACDDHLYHPEIMPYPILDVDKALSDGSPGWISYLMPDDRRLVNLASEYEAERWAYHTTRSLDIGGEDGDDLAWNEVLQNQVPLTSNELGELQLAELFTTYKPKG